MKLLNRDGTTAEIKLPRSRSNQHRSASRLTMGPRRSSRGPVALSAAPRPVVGVRWGLVYGLAKGRAPLMHKFWAPSTNKRTRDKGRGRRWLTARSR